MNSKNQSNFHFQDKLILIFRWINNYCISKSPHRSFGDLRNYVLFVNDDYFIDLPLLLSYMNEIDTNPELTTYER
jgi:hypothetical protein